MVEEEKARQMSTEMEKLRKWREEEEHKRKRAQEVESERVRKEMERRKKEEEEQLERWEAKKRAERRLHQTVEREGGEKWDRNEDQGGIRTDSEEIQPKGVGQGVKFSSETGNGGIASSRKSERARSNIMTFDQIKERDPQGGYISNGGGITLQQVASTPIHRILLSGSGSPTISPSTPF